MGKTIKLLVVGNSFGDDCTHYLHQVARADGVDIKAVNLYIGGCSLYRHYRNMLSGEAVYDYQINGFFTKISTLPVGVVVLAVVAVLVMVVIFSLGISVGIMKKKEF